MGKETDKRYEMLQQVMNVLGGVLCFYPGRGRQCVYVDLDSLVFSANLLLCGQIKVDNYRYEYNIDIDKDEEAIKIYRELAPQTRWRVGCHTHIETIRMNALLQFADMDTHVFTINNT